MPIKFFEFKKSDLKFYGSDALHGFCGVASKECTPEQFGKHIGLAVTQRPFNMYFKVTDDKQSRFVTAKQSYKNPSVGLTDEQTNVFNITPLSMPFHRCNESYQYGDLDYGAKCSCKVSLY